jgi:hypothetical protein
MRPRKIAIGDSITFKAATRSHYKMATRKVVGVDCLGNCLVRYHGWDNFVVLWPEIQAVIKAVKP